MSPMQQCRAQHVGENGQRTRCKNRLRPDEKDCCQEHFPEFRRRMDEEKGVFDETDRLEKLVLDIVRRGYTKCRDPVEVGKMGETVKAYAEHLQRALQGWDEHQKLYFVEPHPTDPESLKSLRDKRFHALTISANIETWRHLLLAQEASRKRQAAAEKE